MTESIASAHAELETRPIPNLIEEFGDAEATLFGQTGTINELASKCPYAGEGMSIEAANMFVVVALNESEAEIDEKYTSYFTQVLEDRGLEVKFSVRDLELLPPADQAAERALEQKKQPERREHGSDTDELRLLITQDTEARAQDLTVESGPAERNYEVSTDSNAGVVSALQMEHWLSRMQAEYEARGLRLDDPDELAVEAGVQDVPTDDTQSLVDRTVELAMPAPVEATDAAEGKLPTGNLVTDDIRPAGRLAEGMLYTSETLPEVPSVFIAAETRQPASKKVKQPHLEQGNEAAVEKGPLPRPLPELPMSKDIGIAEISVRLPQELKDVDLAESVDGEQAQEVLPVFAELLSEVTTSTEESSESAASVVEESVMEVMPADGGSFAELVIEQVRSLPENPDRAAKEQPKVLLTNVLAAALKLQEVRQTEHPSVEIIEEIKEELENLCRQLFESVGVEADEQLIAVFIEKILASDLSQLVLKKLTPQELAQLGTHEYKLEGWFHKFKQLLDSALHPHQLIGRVALNLA